MKLQRTFSCIAGVVFAVGLAASQATAGTGNNQCDFVLEINALRGGSPTVTVFQSKNITAKARIAKGTAPSGTTIDTQLRIDAIDGGQVINTMTSGPIRLGVGKGGQGDKLAMNIPQCLSGSIDFEATFSGPDADGDLCTVSRSINKTCK